MLGTRGQGLGSNRLVAGNTEIWKVGDSPEFLPDGRARQIAANLEGVSKLLKRMNHQVGLEPAILRLTAISHRLKAAEDSSVQGLAIRCSRYAGLADFCLAIENHHRIHRICCYSQRFTRVALANLGLRLEA
jgi:hypothetical protein